MPVMAYIIGHPASTWRNLLSKKVIYVSWHRDEKKQCIRLPWEILRFPRCVLQTEKLY